MYIITEFLNIQVLFNNLHIFSIAIGLYSAQKKNHIKLMWFFLLAEKEGFELLKSPTIYTQNQPNARISAAFTSVIHLCLTIINYPLPLPYGKNKGKLFCIAGTIKQNSDIHITQQIVLDVFHPHTIPRLPTKFHKSKATLQPTELSSQI